MGKLIYRIQGSRLLISSLPGSALRTRLAMSTSFLESLLGKLLHQKDTHLVFSI